VLRPEARVVPLLTLAAGVAVADGVRTATGLTPVLKWPNDVYVDSPPTSLEPGRSIPLGPGRKLGGILAEAGSSSAGGSYVIVGIGLNVRPAAYPPEVASRATSLEGELGHEVDGGRVLAECLTAFAGRYDDLQHDRTDTVLLAWRAYASPLMGRAVEWDDRGCMRRGVAEDVDGTGALVVRTGQGTMRVIAGDVRWI
jgi:BirA family transcriptional regulator, biotin operon repressor / biotin---[acetyl-CoA-carboxylase] ligase